MTNRSLAATLMAVLLLLAGSGWAGEMVEIPGGTYEPFYPIQGEGPITGFVPRCSGPFPLPGAGRP